MSWLTKRIQTARRQEKNRRKQAKGALRQLRVQAGGNPPLRFLSGPLNPRMGQEQAFHHKGERP
jgi:hypothetical protein